MWVQEKIFCRVQKIIGPNSQSWMKWVPYVVALNTLIVFSPFLFHFDVLFSDTDSWFNHYPNLLSAKSALDAGGLPLWNPFLFAGMDFTSSMHNHALNPIFWPVLAFPEEYLLQALTAFFMLCHFLVGWLVYRISRKYLELIPAAFVATAFQVSGFVWFSTTSMHGLILLAASLLSIYLIVYRDKFSGLVWFSALALTLSAMGLMGHPGYVTAFLIPPFVAGLIMFWPRTFSMQQCGYFGLFLSTFFVMLLVVSFRVVPVITFLMNEAHGFKSSANIFMGGSAEIYYLVMTAFIPDIFGLTIGESWGTLKALMDQGKHIQFHVALYYGLLPLAMLIVLAFGTKRWLFALIGGVGVFLFLSFPPVILMLQDVIFAILHPVVHEIVIRAVAPFAVICAFGVCLWSLHSKPQDLNWNKVVLLPTALFCTVAIMAALYIGKQISLTPEAFNKLATDHEIFTLLLANWPFALKAAIIAIGLLAFFVFRKILMQPDGALVFIRRCRRYITGGVFGGLLLLVALASQIHVFDGQLNLTAYALLNDLASVLWAIASVVLLANIKSNAANTAGRNGRIILCTFILLVLSVFLLIPLAVSGATRGVGEVGITSVSSILRFFALAICVVEILTVAFSEQKLGAGVLLVAFIFTFGDLHYFTRNYQYSGAEPFIASSDIYKKLPAFNAPSRKERLVSQSEINLLSNETLTFSENQSLRHWSIGGRSPKVVRGSVEKGESVRLTNTAPDFATLFQDTMIGEKSGPITLGAWVRAAKPGMAGLILGDTQRYQGTGNWEWVTVTMWTPSYLPERTDTIRPHLFVEGHGYAEFSFPRLVRGRVAMPVSMPPGASKPVNETDTLRDNLQMYRFNHTGDLQGLPGGHVFANIFAAYRLMSYGGIDSIVAKSLVDFLDNFEASIERERWIARQGVLPIRVNERLLDLLSVGYDVNPAGKINFRKSALPRFAWFDRFEVLGSQNDAFSRLRAKGFEPRKALILNQRPGVFTKRDMSSKPGLVETAKVTFKSFTHIDIPVNSRFPRVLLFNDMYSPHWKAWLNGKPLSVIKGNGVFMAIPVPAAKGTLSLTFEPTQFLYMMWMAYSVLLVLMIILITGLAHKLRQSLSRR